MRHAVTSSVVPLTALALMAAGCSDSGAPSTAGQVRFNLASTPAPAAVSLGSGSLAVVAAPATYTDAEGNTLTITSAQIVLREIELERAGVDDCAPPGVEDDSCEKLELGPVLLDVPLGTAGAATQFTVAVEPGTYDEVEFEIHKPSDDDDAAFVAAHPEFNDVSIRVTGRFNDSAEEFIFTSDLNVETEIDLQPPLVVGESGAADLTLLVDLDAWFRTGAGTLLDPASANKGQPNEGLVKQNIQASLEAFEDEDRDGNDDHGDDAA